MVPEGPEVLETKMHWIEKERIGHANEIYRTRKDRVNGTHQRLQAPGGSPDPVRGHVSTGEMENSMYDDAARRKKTDGGVYETFHNCIRPQYFQMVQGTGPPRGLLNSKAGFQSARREKTWSVIHAL